MPAGFEANDEPNELNRERSSSCDVDDEIWVLLNLYVDGEADADQSARVEDLMLASCAVARDVRFLWLAGDGARSSIELEPPIALRASIRAATTQRPTVGLRVATLVADWRSATDVWARRLTPVAGLAAAGLAVFAIRAWREPITQPSTRDIGVHVALAAPSTASAATGSNVVASGRHDHAARRTLVATASVRHDRKPEPIQSVPAESVASPSSTFAGGSAPVVADYRPAPMRTAWARPTEPPRFAFAAQASDPTEAPPTRSNDSNTTVVEPREADSNVPVGVPDAINQRPSDPDRITVASANVGSEHERIVAGSANADPVARPSAPVGVRRGRFRRDLLPPDPRLCVTAADMRREHDADTGGYDRAAVEGIQRREATVSVISSKF